MHLDRRNIFEVLTHAIKVRLGVFFVLIDPLAPIGLQPVVFAAVLEQSRPVLFLDFLLHDHELHFFTVNSPFATLILIYRRSIIVRDNAIDYSIGGFADEEKLLLNNHNNIYLNGNGGIKFEVNVVVLAVSRASERKFVFSKLDLLALNFGDLEGKEELVFSLSPSNGREKCGGAINSVSKSSPDGELKKIGKTNRAV